MNNQSKQIEIEANSTDVKEQVSFSIMSEIVESTEETIFFMRKQLSLDKRKKLTKSAFYEIALRVAIADYKDKGQKSTIWKMVEEWIED